MTTCMGIDVSLNHMGLCIISPDNVRFDYITNLKKYQNKELQSPSFLEYSAQLTECQKKYKGREMKEVYNSQRLLVWKYICQDIAQQIQSQHVDIVAIENYAYGASSNAMYQIAEVGGVLRAALLGIDDLKIRLLEPTQVKKWATGNGNAKKVHMVAASKFRGFKFIDQLVFDKSGDLDGPGTDLADAYWLADLAKVESQLRTGEKVMADLEPKAIEVFNAVSNAHPVNILASPYC